MNPIARFKSLRHRRQEPEWMDAPDADPALLETSLQFIRTVNRRLGYTRSTVGHLRRLAAGLSPDRPMTVLDVATGSGDVPRAILAAVKNRPVVVVGLDLHESTIRAAAAGGSDDRLTFVRGDATRLPFADGAFDFVISSMFLHHLDEAGAIGVMREMNRVAGRGVVVADLIRSRRAYAWISLFTAAANPMVRHDARVSVSGAFTTGELIRMRDEAGLSYATAHRHFGHRAVLAGVK